MRFQYYETQIRMSISHTITKFDKTFVIIVDVKVLIQECCLVVIQERIVEFTKVSEILFIYLIY